MKDPVTATSFGFVILNEQVCDGGATLDNGCADMLNKHAGLTVRAIHLVITVDITVDNFRLLKTGTNIIVAEAHSDATFVS